MVYCSAPGDAQAKKTVSGGVKLTLPQAFAELNLSLCGQYKGMNPIELLDYPAEDVFQLINDMIDHNDRAEEENRGNLRQAEINRELKEVNRKR